MIPNIRTTSLLPFLPETPGIPKLHETTENSNHRRSTSTKTRIKYELVKIDSEPRRTLNAFKVIRKYCDRIIEYVHRIQKSIGFQVKRRPFEIIF